MHHYTRMAKASLFGILLKARKKLRILSKSRLNRIQKKHTHTDSICPSEDENSLKLLGGGGGFLCTPMPYFFINYSTNVNLPPPVSIYLVFNKYITFFRVCVK